MVKESTGTIILPTLSAAVLFEHEVRGQISDGMWENSTPYDHWRFWCRLTVEFKKGETARVETPCPGSCLKTGYNVAELYEYVGDRMLEYGRIGRAAESIGMTKLARDQADAAGLLDTLEAYDALMASDGHGYDILSLAKVATLPRDLVESYFKTTYEMKDLRADVKLIKQAMKSVKK